MEQSLGTAAGRVFITLSQSEQRCYSGLCALCQADSSGKLQASRVGELFRASQLPVETLQQLTEVCGAKQLGYFSIGQFHVALKLLAAAQVGLPVRLESIKDELPLPRFPGLMSDTEGWYQGLSPHSNIKGPHFGVSSGQVQRAGKDRSTFRDPQNTMEKQEPQAHPCSPRNSPPDSPSRYSSPTHCTQRNDKDAFVAQQGHGWPMAQQEAYSPKHHTLKTSLGHVAHTQACSMEVLVDHSSEGYNDDPWRITEEQWEYYTHQFKSLQPDMGALILGSVAKDFFTKSKLSILELSHIWDLSDLDHDGALTFSEFCIAFHLIVARKNGYPVPGNLPPGLQSSLMEKEGAPPRTPGEDGFFCVPLAQHEKTLVSPERTEPLISFEETETIQEKKTVETLGPRVEMATPKSDVEQDSSKTAPSPKRAPEDKSSKSVGTDVERPGTTQQTGNVTEPACNMDSDMRPRSRQRSYSSTAVNDSVKNWEMPPAPPPRQQKTHSRTSSLDLNKLLHHSNQESGSALLLPAPVLPPRPVEAQVQHFKPTKERSSQKALQHSEFTKFRVEEKSSIKSSGQKPLSKDTTSIEDTAHTKTETEPSESLPQKLMHRKYRLESQSLDPAQSSVTGTKQAQKLPIRQKREIQAAIRKNKDANAALARINSELQEKLKEVHREKIALESQLESLRPVAFV